MLKVNNLYWIKFVIIISLITICCSFFCQLHIFAMDGCCFFFAAVRHQFIVLVSLVVCRFMRWRKCWKDLQNTIKKWYRIQWVAVQSLSFDLRTTQMKPFIVVKWTVLKIVRADVLFRGLRRHWITTMPNGMVILYFGFLYQNESLFWNAIYAWNIHFKNSQKFSILIKLFEYYWLCVYA